MRRVISLAEHPEVKQGKGRNCVPSPASCNVVGAGGKPTWLGIWGTERGYVVTYGVGLAIDGYFSTEAEAAAAYGDHAALLRREAVVS